VAFEMHNNGPPITEARISAVEHKLGIVLPGGYLAFLMRNNGGIPKPRFFPIRGLDDNPFGGIQLFFGIDETVRSADLEWNYETFSGRIPHNLLPIACDDAGNLICISLNGVDGDMVYLWYHDDEHTPPTYNNVYFIAESFAAFLESIHFEELVIQSQKN